MNQFCEAHGEYTKSTAELSTAVAKLSTVVDGLIVVGKGLFAVFVALIVLIIIAIFSAGELYNRMSSAEEAIKSLSTKMDKHIEVPHD